MRPEFKIELVSRDGVVRVQVDGELDLATAPLLDERLREVEVSEDTTIVIDLQRVSFIDSTGLRVLLAAHTRMQGDDERLQITGAGEQAQRLFELAGVSDRLPFAD